MSDTARNLIRMTVSSVASAGLGTLTLGAAVADYLAFESGDDGLTFTVTITEAGVGQEVRTGCTYTHSGTTLTRGTLEKSTTGAAIAFSSAAIVSVTASADSGRRWNSAALTHVAGADSATTMAVGNLYVVDGATLTADRTYTLPATAAVGDRVGVMMSAGSANYEVLITAASGDTLNAVAGGTEWSRLFITGEVVIMRCVAANATWVVEQDGRIPQAAQINRTAAQTPIRGTVDQVECDTNTFTAIGAITNITTTWDITVRRTGLYGITSFAKFGNINNNQRASLHIYVNGSRSYDGAQGLNDSGSGKTIALTSGLDPLPLSAGDALSLWVFHTDATTDQALAVANAYDRARLAVKELV